MPARRARVRPQHNVHRLFLLAWAGGVLACAGDDRASGGEAAHADGNGVGRRQEVARGQLDVPLTPYRVVAVAKGGSLRGSVLLDGGAPPDTIVRPTSDQRACGQTLVDDTIALSGDALGGVIVWLADVRAGRDLPDDRRYEIENDGCRLTPRVQVAVVDGTLNVRNTDRAPHRNRFLRAGTDEVLALVPQSDHGQVVPLDRLFAQPGLIEVRCDQHPWTRGWIAVFDHPYFAVTRRDGSFALEGVPPGQYRLAAWHERLGTIEQVVTIAPESETTVTLSLKGE